MAIQHNDNAQKGESNWVNHDRTHQQIEVHERFLVLHIVIKSRKNTGRNKEEIRLNFAVLTAITHTFEDHKISM